MAVCKACGSKNEGGARFCSACGSLLLESRARRKTVTVLFADVVRSTELGEDVDAELVRQVLSRWYTKMRTVIVRHGGTLEKFAGDEVMAVFGVPAVHEDDALRAVRAAVEMRNELRALNEELHATRGFALQARIGVNTGEVVAGDPTTRETFVTGDAVNVARRLEQAAAPGEILIGKATYPLVIDAVSVGPLESFRAKGKRDPVAQLRLDDVGAAERGVARRLDAPIVGRESELRVLLGVFERVVVEGGCHLLTLLGDAGIGKSRLVAEFIDSIGRDVRVLRGHCLPYGQRITYWPLAEAVAQAAGLHAGESVEDWKMRIAALVRGADDASALADETAQLLGLSDASSGGDESHAAVRRLLEHLAKDRPLVLAFEDLERSEAAFLDIVDHVVDVSRGHPILIVCVARPELLLMRPAWEDETTNRTMLLLEPLRDEASQLLIRQLFTDAPVDQAVPARIAEAAGGNALFAEQYVAMLVDERVLTRTGGSWTAVGDLSSLALPPTIQALLGARVDQLPAHERGVLERAAIAGTVFRLAAVAALSGGQPMADLRGLATTLVSKRFLQPAQPFAGEETYEFKHPLILDAVYAATSKEVRAALHEQFASWLEAAAGEAALEHDEMIGYHLEQAYVLRSQLGLVDEHARVLARAAVSRLAAAGGRALARDDQVVARHLLERAAAIVPDPTERVELLPQLGEALLRTGDLEAARRAYEEGVDVALVQGDRRAEALARLGHAKACALADPIGAWASAAREREQALRLLEGSGDDTALALTLRDMAEDHFDRGQVTEGIATLERALHHAERADDERRQARIRRRLVNVVVTGPTPVGEAARYAEELELWAQAHGNRGAGAWAALGRGLLAAALGRFEAARALVSGGMRLLEDGSPLQFATAAYFPFLVEMLADRPVEAERAVHVGYDLLQRMGERAYLSSHAALLAHAAYAQGSVEDADRLSATSEALAARGDLSSQILWRSARAKVLARQGAMRRARMRAREAVELAERTINHFIRTDSLRDLAEVQLIGGREAEAANAIEQALRLYELKGNAVSARKARLVLGEITSSQRREPAG